jgi:hypothetical protein
MEGPMIAGIVFVAVISVVGLFLAYKSRKHS